MYWTRKHVVVCTASHCAQKGANELIGKLRLEIVRRGLDSEILINNCGTIDLCDIGPNLVIYPDNVILSGLQAKDVKRLVDYLNGQGDLSEFETHPHSEGEARRRALYEDVLNLPAPVSAAEFLAIVQRYGESEAWIDEQARRGFIARKPDADGNGTVVTITSKTRSRYSI